MILDERFADALIPTHFDPLPPAYRHVFCAFTVDVPADFGVDERIVWRLTSNGQTLEVPGKIIPPYVMDPASAARRKSLHWSRSEEGRQPSAAPRNSSTHVQHRGRGPLDCRPDRTRANPNLVGWRITCAGASASTAGIRVGTGFRAERCRPVSASAGEYVIRSAIRDIASFSSFCINAWSMLQLAIRRSKASTYRTRP